MPNSFLDHITVTAPSLDVGAAFVAETLGVWPQIGGEHPLMATHNLLLRLGEEVFLEVIAANPAVPPPGRPRWFGLDQLEASSRPALRAWVARTPAIHATRAAATERLGEIETLSRGARTWLMTVPADGALVLAGAAPALIEWSAGHAHPAAGLDDQGLSLQALVVIHPEPARLARLYASLALSAPVSVRAALPGEPAHGLVAEISTPQGIRRLSI